MKLIWSLAAALFVLALPLALISSNLRYLVNDPNTYANGFDKYGIEEVTGLSRQELLKGAAGLRQYFESDQEPIDVKVEKQGETIPLFRDREVIHLKDVKDLIRLFYRIQVISLVYLVGFVVVVSLVRQRTAARYVAKVVLWSGIVTLGLLVGLGVAAMIDFDNLFLTFHLLSFSNDFWMLDPQRDYLIMMFPEGFFYDSALQLITTTVGELILAMLIAAAFLYAGRRKRVRSVGSARQ